MIKKEHRNKYKVGVADYLFAILQKINKIENKLTKITNKNGF